MATGLTTAQGVGGPDGVDFDDFFELRSGQTPVSDTGIKTSAGEEIALRYAPASAGTPAGNCGWKHQDGRQLGPLFAAKGGVVYWDGTLADLPTTEAYFNTSDPQNYALVEFVLFANGDIRYRNNKGDSEQIIGNWHGSIADGSNTEVRCQVVSVDQDTGAGNNVTASPSSYQSISGTNGIISVQTGTTQGNVIEVTFRVYLRNTGDASSEISKLVTLRAQYGL